MVDAFVPFPLPPADPLLQVAPKDLQLAEEALRRLDLVVEMVPSIDWFIYGFVRKEAVLSSQIEGVEATLADLMTVEAQAPSPVDADVQDVCNYLVAVEYARAEIVKPTTRPTATKAILSLVDVGVLKEVSGKQRDRSFVYVAYLDLLASETAPS